MKYKHYAPEAPLTLVDGSPAFIQSLVNEKRAEGLRVGVYTVEEHKNLYEADIILTGGSLKDLRTVAENMYGVLRRFDHEGPDVIYGEAFPYDGIGEAIMNRLLKAASGRIVKEG